MDNIATTNENVNKGHKCEICEKVFSKKWTLQRHIITVHDQNGVC